MEILNSKIKKFVKDINCENYLVAKESDDNVNFRDLINYSIGYGNYLGEGFCKHKGKGIVYFNDEKVYYINNKPIIIKSVRGPYASGFLIKDDLSLVPISIIKLGKYYEFGKDLHEAEVKLSKRNEMFSESERINLFINEFPSIDSTASGRVFALWHIFLCGSCNLGVKYVFDTYHISKNRKYTVYDFLNSCKNMKGGDVLYKIRKKYK